MGHQELADALFAAERDRVEIAPLTELDPTLTLGDAYAIAQRNVDRRLASGRVLQGRKVGLISRPTQHLDAPDVNRIACGGPATIPIAAAKVGA